jgi:hypothetical protein
MDPRATDKESFLDSDQYSVSYFTLGERPSFSFPSFRIDGSKDSTGLAADLSS